MQIEKLKPENYEELFRLDGFPPAYYISELFMHQYKNFDCLLIYDKGIWQTFLPKERFNSLLKEGAEFYKNRESFLQYKKEFDNYMKKAEEFFEKYKELPEKITKQIFDEISHTMREHWVHYHKTEFFYSNQAYLDAQKKDASSDLKKNLFELEDIKTKGRIILNQFTLSPQSIYVRLVNTLSKQYSIDFDLIGALSYTEFVKLLEQGSVDLEETKKRKEHFAMMGDNGKLIEFNYEESGKLCKIFYDELKRVDILQGTVANKGIVRGKVVVVLPQLFTEEFIKEKLEKMDNYPILVAHTTSPDLIELCKKAKAIVTDQGGLGSHAAIVSRELNIPCIVGTKKGTKVVNEGDEVEVNANDGYMRIIREDDKVSK